MNDDLDQLNEMWNLTSDRCIVCDGNRYIATPDGAIFRCDWCTQRDYVKAGRRNLAILGGFWLASWIVVGVAVYAGYRLIRWIAGWL